MKKVLIAVDSIEDSKGILSTLNEHVSTPENVVLVHVEQLEGNALMTAMLSDSEMETLKESIKGTEHKERLDAKAEKVLNHYRMQLEKGTAKIKTVIREGHPSEEILKVAEEEAVDLILIGCSGKSRMRRMVTGCSSREVEKNSKIPVLISKGNGCGDHGHVASGREAYALR